MGFDFIKKLPTPEEIRNQYPIDAEIQAVKDARDKELRDVFTGKSDKFLAIIGPCSADNEDAVLDYLTRLRNVQEKIADKVLIVPRVYTNKPRTTGEGYKGMVHQPDPEKQPNLLAGLVAIRKMHIHAIQTSGMTCADEMLYPENYRYLSDLLSYVAVGARSVEDQQHRLTVSGMEVPAGMKNPTSGDLAVMLNSVVAAQGGHRFIYRSWEVETTGNELAHTILRGAVNKHGEAIPNYHYEDLRLLWEKYQEKNLRNPAVIVDTNHSNSNKQYDQQVRIAKEVLHSRQVDPELHTLVKGLMIESYIEPGNQKIGCDHIYGKSITDPLLFINNIPYSLIRWIAVITLSVNSTCYDITGKNYSATHCLLLFAIKAGDLLDSVKKASINCSKQTIEAFSFDIIAILINNKFLMTWMCFHIHITHFIHIHAQINLRSGNIGMSQHFLNASYIRTILQHMHSKRMSQCMRGNIPFDTGIIRISL